MDFVEKLSGKGKVFEGTKFIADVDYDISVYQDRIDTSSHDGPSSVPGLKRVVLALNRHVGEIGGKLTLVLEDGKKMDFFVSGNRLFTPTGPIA